MLPETQPPASPEAATPAATEEASPIASPVADLPTEVSLELEDIKYSKTEITIPADTDVIVNLTNKGALPHDFTIDELNISSGTIPSGGMATVKINAPKGTYTYYCTQPGHRREPAVRPSAVVDLPDSRIRLRPAFTDCGGRDIHRASGAGVRTALLEASRQ